MLNFLKNLFQKEEEITETEEVKEAELEEWLNQKVFQIDIKGEIVDFYNQLKDKKWVLNEKIEVLENTKLNEKEKVEEKIQNIVLGHKDNYIKVTKQFVENLIIPEEKTLSAAIIFSQELNQSLDEVAQRTAKSYQASQHLFFNQVEDIFNNLGAINSQVKGFNKKL